MFSFNIKYKAQEDACAQRGVTIKDKTVVNMRILSFYALTVASLVDYVG